MFTNHDHIHATQHLVKNHSTAISRNSQQLRRSGPATNRIRHKRLVPSPLRHTNNHRKLRYRNPEPGNSRTIYISASHNAFSNSLATDVRGQLPRLRLHNTHPEQDFITRSNLRIHRQLTASIRPIDNGRHYQHNRSHNSPSHETRRGNHPYTIPNPQLTYLQVKTAILSPRTRPRRDRHRRNRGQPPFRRHARHSSRRYQQRRRNRPQSIQDRSRPHRTYRRRRRRSTSRRIIAP